MEMKKAHWIGIVFAVLTLLGDFIFLLGEPLFPFLLGVALVVAGLPFLVTLIVSGNVEKEMNEKFLEFSRNLAESVKSGTPIGKSILNLSNKDFGSLSPHVKKLANQISLGIPIGRAFHTFAIESESNTIQRAVSSIREAESAGGEIENILESVAKSFYQIEKLKKERAAAVSGMIVQGYIIFFIFVGIMLVMQFKILPITANIGSFSSVSSGSAGAVTAEQDIGKLTEELARPFLYLLIMQGLGAGLVIGKLSEGNIKAGIKHSAILASCAFLISSGANALL